MSLIVALGLDLKRNPDVGPWIAVEIESWRENSNDSVGLASERDVFTYNFRGGREGAQP
jgi:hypothetical protein